MSNISVVKHAYYVMCLVVAIFCTLISTAVYIYSTKLTMIEIPSSLVSNLECVII